MILNLIVISLCVLILVVSSAIGHRIDEAIEESFNDLDQATKKSFPLPRGLTRRRQFPHSNADPDAGREPRRRKEGTE